MKAFFILFWFQFLGGFCVLGQPSQNHRAVLPIRNDFTEFEVWPQPDSSVFVLIKEASFRRNATPYLLVKFNQELVQVWQQNLALPRGASFLRAAFNKNSAYLLFETARNDEFKLLQVQLSTNEFIITNHRLPSRMTFLFTGMEVLEGNIFLSGLQNDRLTVLHLAPDQPLLRKLPAIYDQPSALAAFQADTVANRMEFIFSESNGLKARLQIKRLSPDGRLFSTSFLQSADHNYLSGHLTLGDSTRKTIAGTYSLRDLRYPQGFFTGPFSSLDIRQFRFYDFTTFSHYFDYMRPGRQEKVKRRLDRFRLASKTFLLRQRLLLHELYPYRNGFILAGELYYPQYEGDGGGNRIFSGYEFSQVVVAAFDAQGTLQWENSYPLENARHFELQQTTIAGVNQDQLIICYPDQEEDAIRYKVISGSETTPNSLYTKPVTLNPAETILSTHIYGVNHWYGAHFLVFGDQKVRGGSGQQTVFFLNKLTF